MRVLFFILIFLPFYLLTISVNAATQPLLRMEDINRDPTNRAIVTFASAEGDSVKAMMFHNVPDLQSCFALAYTAAKKGHRESTATCLNGYGNVAGTYYCEPKSGSDPYCRAGFP